MKFVLFVEGHTEQGAIPEFLKRWLDPRLRQEVRIKPVRFEGKDEFLRKIDIRVREHLGSPDGDQILAAIGLLDLYGPAYPHDRRSAAERYEWGKRRWERKIGSPRFRMFYAVHEIEAFILSDPRILPPGIRDGLPKRIERPESVNFHEPPSKLLERLYLKRLRRSYKKAIDGTKLFRRLDPEVVYAKCPHFASMVDEMLQIARDAGL